MIVSGSISNLSQEAFWSLSILGVAIVIYFFVMALLSLHKKRLIQDIPISLLRSASQGYTELSGSAEKIDGLPVLAPLSGRECLWYRVVCEELSSRNNIMDWLPASKIIFNLLPDYWQTSSSNIQESDDLFYLDDATGHCVIDPEGARITPTMTQTWYGNSPVPDRGPALSGSPIGSRYRYQEELLLPGDPLYVLGQLETISHDYSGKQIEGEIVETLHEWKKDQETLLENFDSNNDGVIDMTEWERARRRAKREVAERLALDQTRPVINIMKDPQLSRRPYIISSKPLPDLEKHYHYRSVTYFSISLCACVVIVYMLNIHI